MQTRQISPYLTTTGSAYETSFPHPGPAALLLALMHAQTPAVAQRGNATSKPGISPALAEPVSNETRQIPVKNVSADIVAYWLDPAHHPLPQLLKSMMSNEPVDQKAIGSTAPIQGIDRITVAAPNSLQVVGTPGAINALQKVVNVLDRPLRQVMIEMQAVQIDEENLKPLLRELNDANENPQKNRFSLARPAWSTLLNGLIA